MVNVEVEFFIFFLTCDFKKCLKIGGVCKYCFFECNGAVDSERV